MAINLELHLDHLQISEDTREWIDGRLAKLESGRRDITGAHLSVKQMSGKPTVNEYEATLTLYHKPDNISGSSKQPAILDAVQDAFASVERQLKKARAAVVDRRKRVRKDVDLG